MNMRNANFGLRAAALMVLFLAIDSAHAGLKTVTVEGFGMDKSAAVRAALRKAIEEAGGVKITSASKMENYQLVLDTVLATSTGVVKQYDVLETKRQDEIVFAKVKATVSDENLFDDFDAVRVAVEQKGAPKVLVMVSEQNVGSQKPSEWWASGSANGISLDLVENDIMKRWRTLGMRFVDRQALSGKLSMSQPSNAEVKQFATDAGADVVVMGKAIATMGERNVLGTNMSSVQGQLSLRVLYVDSAEVIGSTTQQQTQNHVNPELAGNKALIAASAEAARELLKQVMERWTKELSGPQRLEVTATGFKRSRDFRKFMKMVKSKLNKVQEIRQRGYKKGKAEFDVVFTGNAFEFGDVLESSTFAGISVELQEVSGNTLTFNVVK